MKTVVIDAGHGGRDTGASYQNHLEKNVNLKLALKLRDRLTQNYHVNVQMTRTKDKTVSLDARTDFANEKNADYFCSIHHNAAGGDGFESYIFNGQVPKSTRQAQDTIHDKIIQQLASKYDIDDRGQKRANFHVLRETKMSAILLEMLFIDNAHDLKRITDPAFRQDAAAAIAEGIADALALPAAKGKTLYHVIAGSFKEKENAKSRVDFLNQQQIEAVIKETQISGETYHRVQAGAFRKRANANRRTNELKKMDIAEPFITTSQSQTKSHQSGNGNSNASLATTSIRGKTRLTAAEMDQFAAHLNADAPELGTYYETFGKHYGIRGDMAFAQALHETDDFRFTGIVNPEQHNYSGIGATGPKESGNSFSTPEKGVLAHIQHLYAYATSSPLPEGHALIDPRYNKVNRGSAKTWQALNGKWAVPGKGYGQKIARKYKQMKQFSKDKSTSPTLQPIRRLLEKLWKLIKKTFKG